MFLWFLNVFFCVSATNFTINHHKLVAEAALGGMIPPTLIVLLAAIIRILQIYKQRKQQQQHSNIELKEI